MGIKFTNNNINNFESTLGFNPTKIEEYKEDTNKIITNITNKNYKIEYFINKYSSIINIQIIKIFYDFFDNHKKLDNFLNDNDYIVKNLKIEKLKIFIGKEGFFPREKDFPDLVNGDNNFLKAIKEIISDGIERNFNFFFNKKNGFFQNKENIKYILQNFYSTNLFLFICYGDLSKIKIFLGENGIFKTEKDFIDLIKKHKKFNDIYFFTKYYEEEGIEDLDFGENFLKNLEYFFGKKGKYNTKEKILNLMLHKNWEHIKKLIKNGTIEEIEKIFKLTPENGINYNYNVVNIKENPGACSLNDDINELILTNSYYQVNPYVKIFLENNFIGILKTEGEKTFLSFENIFDKNKKLIFTKNMIYYLKLPIEENNLENIKEYKIKGNIRRNPLRFSRIKNIDELIKNFLENKN